MILKTVVSENMSLTRLCQSRFCDNCYLHLAKALQPLITHSLLRPATLLEVHPRIQLVSEDLDLDVLRKQLFVLGKGGEKKTGKIVPF